MDLLKQYSSGAGSSGGEKPQVNAAPEVPVRVIEGDLLKGSQVEVYHNPRANALFTPEASVGRSMDRMKGGNVGIAEEHAMSEWSFKNEHNASLIPHHQQQQQQQGAEKKKKKKTKEDAASDSFMGPWGKKDQQKVAGGMTVEELEELGKNYERAKREREETTTTSGVVEEQSDVVVKNDVDKMKKKKKKQSGRGEAPGSIPCGVVMDASEDYQGRKWWEQGEKRRLCDVSFCAKKKEKVVEGHEGGVMAMRMKRCDGGKMLASAGMDGAVRWWGTSDSRKLKELGSVWGHTKGVKDVRFIGKDERSMCSNGYDALVCLWDVERAALVSSSSLPCIAFCMQHCWEASEHEVLLGCQDNKIRQMDLRSMEIVQTYDRHMGPVNCIVYFDSGRRFISSSDDKTLRYWDYGTPVEIKTHQEPHMHSMPAASVNEHIGWAAFQSMDNQILLYGVNDTNGFKLNRKKRYVGHLVAGYACGLDFSPDGQFIASGDSEGKLFVWDVVTAKAIRKLPGHKGHINSVLWDPFEASRIYTGGADGKIISWV